MRTFPTRRHGRRAAGQSLTEVIVIVFLVAIGTIGVVGLFGDNIRGLFGASAESLAGEPNVQNPGKGANNTQWNMKGGSLSPYGSSAASFNSGGSSANGGDDIFQGGPFTPPDYT